MKFFAILKDSLREAIDCKVLYVTVSLSGLVILAVASISYKPRPAETLMRDLVEGNFSFLMGMAKGEPMVMDEEGKPPQQDGKQADHFMRMMRGPFRFEEVRVLKGDLDSPDSEYAVTVSMELANKEEADKVRRQPGPALERLKKRFATVEEWDLLKVSELRHIPVPKGPKADAANTVFFEVQTEPTAATRRLWFYEPSLFFGAVPLGANAPLGWQLYLIASVVLSIGSWVTILVSVIITAFFIPNMLRKGTVDLMLVKPIRRWSILLFKYLGGLTFIFLNTALAVGGIWLALGLRSGIWANSFLLMIFIITYFFAILYAVSTLFAVLTRSAVVAILMTCGAWFFFWVAGTANMFFEAQRQQEETSKTPPENRISDGAVAGVVKAIHKVTPRTSDLNQLGGEILMSEFLTGKLNRIANPVTSSISWGESLTASGVFMALMLGLSCWWFATKDY